MSWKNLVEALNLEPHKLAYYLTKEPKDATLVEEAVMMGQRNNLRVGTDGAILMAAAAASPSTKYFLVNLSGVVSILYGMTKCFELVQTGCYYVLKGDYARVHPNAPVIPPDLQVLPGGDDAMDPRIMSNQSGWCHKDPGETKAFRASYYELLAHRALIRASPPVVDTRGARLLPHFPR
jgi:hypothetical protein